MRRALNALPPPNPPGHWRRSRLGLSQKIQAELHRILAGGVRQLVDEGLHHERQRVAGRRAQRAGADRQRLGRRVQRVVRDERLRELGRADGAADGNRSLAVGAAWDRRR